MKKLAKNLMICVLLPLAVIALVFYAILTGSSPGYESIPDGTGSSSNTVVGLWLREGTLWHLKGSSLLYRGDEEAVDLPTYKVDFRPEDGGFYYVHKHALWRWDPASEQAEKLCRIDGDADYLCAVTQHYALATDGYLLFPVELETQEIRQMTLPGGTLVDCAGDALLFIRGNELIELRCDTGEVELLYQAEETLCWACYGQEAVSVLRDGTLVQIDRATGEARERALPFDGVRVEDDGRLWLLESRSAEDGCFRLHLWQYDEAGGFLEQPLEEHLIYTPALDQCRLEVEEQTYAIASEIFLTTGEIS